MFGKHTQAIKAFKKFLRLREYLASDELPEAKEWACTTVLRNLHHADKKYLRQLKSRLTGFNATTGTWRLLSLVAPPPPPPRNVKGQVVKESDDGS